MYKYYTDHFWGELDDWERDEKKGFSLCGAAELFDVLWLVDI